MLRVALTMFAMLSLTACAPNNNPIMALGQNVNTSTAPLQEYKAYFKEPLSDVYDALLIASEKNDIKIIDRGGVNSIVLMHYDYSFTKNVWGGPLRVGLDSVNGATRLSASFYEKSTYVTNSIFNPLVSDMNMLLSKSGSQSDKR